MYDFIISLFNLDRKNIRSIKIIEDDSHKFHAYIQTIPQEMECPFCRGPIISNGFSRTKVITHKVLTDKKLDIHWRPHRFLCKHCKHTITEFNPFTFPGFNISFLTMRNIMFDLRNPNLTYKDIALKNDVSISQVVRYFDSYVHIPRPSLPENIGIDEIHSDMAKYGGSYLLVIVDNEKRQLIDILPNRSKKELTKYFDSFSKEERNNVKFVTMDMYRPYYDVCSLKLKNAKIAVDPFHVVKHLMDGLTRLRLNLMYQVEYGSPSYYLLKRWNKLLTSSSINLDNEQSYNHVFHRYMNKRDLLEALLSISEDLALAFSLKEIYRDFNDNCPPEEAKAALKNIIDEFTVAQIPEYQPFLNILNEWEDQIVNSFVRPTGRKQSNALTENINSQIRSYLAVSKGISNFERFRRRILYCLNDKVFYSTTSVLTSLKRTKFKKK